MPDIRDNKATKKPALGKGLNSLLGLNDQSAASPKSPTAKVVGGSGGASEIKVPPENLIRRISPDDIEPNPHQPRKVFNQDELLELANSLKVDGIVQPLIVAKSDRPNKYVLIAGERRWRASKLAGLGQIPVIVKDVTSDDMLRIALIENIQRADLNALEEAQAYASLINDFGLTQEQCAKKVGKDRVTVTNFLRLLTLPKEVQDDLLENRLTMGHGRALLSLEDKRLILRARDIVVKKKLSVRQTEQLCKRMKTGDPQKPGATAKTAADLEYLAENLRSHLRTKVKFSGTGARGRIEISYFSAAELERVLTLIGPGSL